MILCEIGESSARARSRVKGQGGDRSKDRGPGQSRLLDWRQWPALEIRDITFNVVSLQSNGMRPLTCVARLGTALQPFSHLDILLQLVLSGLSFL